MILRADKSRMADAVSLSLKLWSGHSEKELTEELSPLAEGEKGCNQSITANLRSLYHGYLSL